MIDKVREIALKALYEINTKSAYSNIILDELINQNRKNLTNNDIGLISEIVYGTVTWRLTLDTIVEKYSSIKIKKISPWIINILRMGIYQIVFLDKIPKSAAVNESVNLAKRYGHRSSSNFVNAILRKVEKKDYEELFEIENDIERISKTTSMPIWIIEELKKENDIYEIEKICKNSNIKPKICIRTNLLKISKEELEKRLNEKGITTEDTIVDSFLVLDKVKNIENLSEFREGLFTVQDEAAGLIPVILDAKSNEKVLDACSAPGGKTTFLAENMNNIGEITAWDIHEHRLKLVDDNAKRLSIDIIKTEKQDAMIYNERYEKYFDKILLDVPCLGMGVMRRKPDIKWQKQENDIKIIQDIQYKILENCAKYLKSGGDIVYSTCSIFKEENISVIEKFMKNNKNYEIVLEEKYIKKEFEKYVREGKYIQVLPNEKTDGFFIVKFKKN